MRRFAFFILRQKSASNDRFMDECKLDAGIESRRMGWVCAGEAPPQLPWSGASSHRNGWIPVSIAPHLGLANIPIANRLRPMRWANIGVRQ